MVMLLALIAIVIAEIVTVVVSPIVGLSLHAMIVLLLLIPPMRKPDTYSMTWFAALVMLPLLRILSYTIPYSSLEPYYWLAMIGIPLWLGIGVFRIFVIHDIEFFPPLRSHGVLLTLVTGVAIVPIALLGYYLAPDVALYSGDLSSRDALIMAVMLVIFAAFLEEILFRRLLLTVTVQQFGKWVGIALSGYVYGMMFLGTGSVPYIVLMAVLGTWWGWLAYRMDSIWATGFAHGIFLVLLYVVLPGLL